MQSRDLSSGWFSLTVDLSLSQLSQLLPVQCFLNSYLDIYLIDPTLILNVFGVYYVL